MAYINDAVAADAKGELDCIFCALPGQGDDEAALVIARSGEAYALLNAFPYNTGHLMVAPFRHVAEVEDLSPGEVMAVFGLAQTACSAVKAAYRPNGMNLGMNLGRSAGAGFPGHLHLHIVPRWDGDTNFMPVVGETKVMPETLEESYGRLREEFDRLGDGAEGD